MNCPSCNRNLASTLSICPSCGTMVFDSVREELALKISSGVKMTTSEPKEKPVISITSELPSPAVEIPVSVTKTPADELIVPPVNEPVVKKRQTAPLPARPTSPTLVGFSNKNAALPDWRLQMQNAVVKRRGGRENLAPTAAAPAKPQVAVSRSHQSSLTTQGATALKVEAENKPSAELTALERALLRIEESRQKFLAEGQKETQQPVSQSSVKQFPSFSQSRRQENSAEIGQTQAVVKFTTKPKVSSINELKAEKFDTNKLPPLPAKISSSFENRPVIYADLSEDLEDEKFIRNAIDNTSEVTAYEEAVVEAQSDEDIDDCAPLSLRFNAAIFDLLISAFISLLVLSPFMLLSENFFSSQGFLAFVVTCAIVMFVYMTATIGFLGRTFGMKLFSLEIVDIDENAYPTVHQAAVSSSVYLVSLALGGLGFLTLLLNNEKRAAHDLLSGTIIVKEY